MSTSKKNESRQKAQAEVERLQRKLLSMSRPDSPAGQKWMMRKQAWSQAWTGMRHIPLYVRLFASAPR